jgi:pyruvate kinase
LKKIIATVGPSLLSEFPINKVHTGAQIYRINGAHGTVDTIYGYIEKIRQQVSDAEILVDLPGNKVRTANIDDGQIEIRLDEEFSLKFDQFNFPEFYKYLTPGDIVWANDSTFQFIVMNIDVADEEIRFLSKSFGMLLNNKGMHVRGIHKHIPFLFSRDLELIDIANEANISYVGLSFVRNAADIQEARNLIQSEIELISKVETEAAVRNLNEILGIAEYILVDRGDLSTEVGLEKVPKFQQFIIEKALFHNRKVFLATQFLKNMEKLPIATIPEVIDLYNTLQKGIYGIQLSEETAVGSYPYECIQMIERISNEIDNGVLSELK